MERPKRSRRTAFDFDRNDLCILHDHEIDFGIRLLFFRGPTESVFGARRFVRPEVPALRTYFER